MKQKHLAIKPPVHELKTEHGKLWVYRLKPPRFKAAFVNGALQDIKYQEALPPDNEASLLKKALAFIKSKSLHT